MMPARRLIAGEILVRHRLDVCADGRPGGGLEHFCRGSERIDWRVAD